MPFSYTPASAEALNDAFELAYSTLGDGGTRVERAPDIVYLTVYEFRWTFPETFIAELPYDAPLKALLLAEQED
jgi:hypothetical protein